MKAFNFSLQKLLNLKEASLKAEEVRMRDAVVDLNKTRDGLDNLRADMDLHGSSTESAIGTRSTLQFFLLNLKYTNRLRREMEQQLDRISQQEDSVREIRDELLIAIRERKKLERFKEKERGAWAKKIRILERGIADKIASTGFLRNKRLAMEEKSPA